MNRSDLQSFHGSLQRYLERELGHEVSVLNDATKEGNRSIEELKRQSATERLREATAEASKIVSEAQNDVKVLNRHKTALKGQIEGLRRDVLTAGQVKDVPHSKALVGDKQVVATEDFEALCKTAATAEAMLREIEPARAVNMQADTILKNAQLKAEGIIEQARRKANTMEEHLESVKYRKKLMHVESVINSDPSKVKHKLTA